MALIKCGDCGKDISSDATSCIYCGKPNGKILDGNKLRNSFAYTTLIAYRIFVSIIFSVVILVSLALHSFFGVLLGSLSIYIVFSYTKKYIKS